MSNSSMQAELFPQYIGRTVRRGHRYGQIISMTPDGRKVLVMWRGSFVARWSRWCRHGLRLVAGA